MSEAVQDRYAPSSICFGCGPANTDGLRIKSIRDGEGLRMAFQPQAQHQAFPGVINGGIIGALLDCHGNWTAAIAIMDRLGLEQPLCTVTAQYEVKLRRPTPFGPRWRCAVACWCSRTTAPKLCSNSRPTRKRAPPDAGCSSPCGKAILRGTAGDERR